MPSLAVGTLTGTHVVLEPLRLDHIDEIAAAAGGDRSTFDRTPVPEGADEADRYVRALLAEAERGVAAPFAQRRQTDGVVVGCTRYLDPHWPLGREDPDEIEVGGTWLSIDAQRTAINTEAKLMLFTHAFDVWKVQRIAICTDEQNMRSRRAIERLGAHLDGILSKHRRAHVVGHTPGLRNTAMYSILDDDWPQVRERLVGALSARSPGAATPPAAPSS